MLVSSEVIAQVYSNIFYTVHYFQSVSVELLGGLSLKASGVMYSDDLTLFGMKLHQPLLSLILLAHLDHLAVSWSHPLF